jgi:hypothetical protein
VGDRLSLSHGDSCTRCQQDGATLVSLHVADLVSTLLPCSSSGGVLLYPLGALVRPAGARRAEPGHMQANSFPQLYCQFTAGNFGGAEVLPHFQVTVRH